MSRRPRVAIEDSWRVVDGENDSFDTRYLSSFDDDHDDDHALPPSNNNSQLSNGYSSSQYSAGMSFESQDSIRDFSNHHDDEQVILREPFRPTVPASVTSGSTATTMTTMAGMGIGMGMSRGMALGSEGSLYPQSPDLQLRMPRVDVDSDLASSGSLRDSLRTARGGWHWNQSSTEALNASSPDYSYSEESPPARSRRKSSQGRPRESLESIRRTVRESRSRTRTGNNMKRASRYPRPWRNLRLVLVSLVAPIVLGLAAYLFFFSSSSSSSPSPYSTSLALLCRVPGASLLSPSFCSSLSERPGTPRRNKKPRAGTPSCTIDFTELIATQAKISDILSQGRHLSRMPLDLESSQISTRNLRASLKDSSSLKALKDSTSMSLRDRDALIAELNAYIDTIAHAGPDLQTLSIHIGSTVDAIINISRWTLRHLASLAVEPAAAEAPPFLAWLSFLLHPLRPSRREIHDRILLDKFTEHIALVQDRLARLGDEAASLTGLLDLCRAHLHSIQVLARKAQPPCDHVPAAPSSPSSPGLLLSAVWSFLSSGFKTKGEDQRCAESLQPEHLDTVDGQLALVMPRVQGIIDAVGGMRAELDDLLNRAGEPSSDGHGGGSTLSEQMDVVRGGLRGLEDARAVDL